MSEETLQPGGSVDNSNPATGVAEIGTADIANQSNAKSEPQPEKGAAAESKSDGGIFSGLLQRIRGNSAACTCGKPPGERGRHKETCATRAGKVAPVASPGMFGPVVLPDAAPVVASPAPMVRPVVDSAPRDRSFYGKFIKTLANARSKFRVRGVEKKWEPVVGEKEAAAIASEFGISDVELADLEKDIIEAAEKENWPEVHPIGKVLMTLANWELHNLMRDLRLNARLKKLEAATQIQNSNAAKS